MKTAEKKKTTYGLIDDKTPVGRVFEFDEGAMLDGDDVPMPAALKYIGPDGDMILLVTPGGEEWPLAAADDQDERIFRDEWNKKFAPHCTGYTDPASLDDAPEAVEAPAPAADKALAEVGKQLGEADDLQARMKDALRAYDEAAKNYETLHEQAKDAKDRMEVADMAWKSAARAMSERDAEMPLFGKADPAVPKPDKPEDESDKPEGDSWREVALVELRKTNGRAMISQRVITALAEHNPPIVNLGALADWQKKKGEFWAKDIKGLGERGRQQIEDAVEHFWAKERKPAKK